MEKIKQFVLINFHGGICHIFMILCVMSMAVNSLLPSKVKINRCEIPRISLAQLHVEAKTLIPLRQFWVFLLIIRCDVSPDSFYPQSFNTLQTMFQKLCPKTQALTIPVFTSDGAENP